MNVQITVEGTVDETWSDWFSGMDIHAETAPDGTVLTRLAGPVVDQPGLRGILNRLWDLNLALISVIQLDRDAYCR